ncbi:carbohydrate ABC transporter permease [Paenibacillus sp. GCM10028914]|uniref:carbohydrate ABC transporter permease n=1 Tax=Paenibacillus sp. GCM10028914 TaxID=3273416 RepID=UPI003617DDA2
MSARTGDNIFQFSINIVLFLIAVTMFFPFLYVVAVSFTDPSVYNINSLVLWPEKWSLKAYEYILSGGAFWNAFKSSVFITVAGTIIAILVTSTMGYMLSKSRLPGRKWFLRAILITMLFSPGLIPNYLIVRQLGLIDSLWAIILPGATSAWSLLVLKSFYQGIPEELEESAKIDGSNDMGIFFKIILPLAKAPIAAITLFFAVGFWNAYFSAIVYLQDSMKWPLQVLLQQIVLAANASQFVDSATALELQSQIQIPGETIKMAAIVIVMVPILVVYPFLQKYFAKGVLIGSVKG